MWKTFSAFELCIVKIVKFLLAVFSSENSWRDDALIEPIAVAVSEFCYCRYLLAFGVRIKTVVKAI